MRSRAEPKPKCRARSWPRTWTASTTSDNITADGPMWVMGQLKHGAAQGRLTVIEQSRCGRGEIKPIKPLAREVLEDLKHSKGVRDHDEL